MPFAPINLLLDHDIPHEDTLSIPYPSGQTRQSYQHGSRHTLSARGKFFNSPRDFSVNFEPDRILIYWYGGLTLPKGEILTVQLEQIGRHFFVDPKTGQRVHNTIESNTFLINLGTPLAVDELYLADPMEILNAGTLPLKHQQLDVPRNITISSNGDASQCNFIVRGEGIYGRTISEEIPGPDAGTSIGQKAFYVIHHITATQPCSAEIHIGCGDRLGLPVYIEGNGYLIKEMMNGNDWSGGILRGGESNPATLQNGDRRGTYTPAEAEDMLNGDNNFQLIVSLPNPGNIGSMDVQD